MLCLLDQHHETKAIPLSNEKRRHYDNVQEVPERRLAVYIIIYKRVDTKQPKAFNGWLRGDRFNWIVCISILTAVYVAVHAAVLITVALSPQHKSTVCFEKHSAAQMNVNQ